MKEDIEKLEKLEEYKAYVEACERNQKEQDDLLEKLKTPVLEYYKKKLSNKVFRDNQDMVCIREVTDLSINEDLMICSNIILDYTVFSYDETGVKITKRTRMDLDDIDKLIELSQEEVENAKNKILDFIYSELISTPQTTFKAEELESISTINTKTIDWEQRRFELIKEMLNSEYIVCTYKESPFDISVIVPYVTENADEIIEELKKEKK